MKLERVAQTLKSFAMVPMALFLATLFSMQPAPTNVEAQAPKPQQKAEDHGRGRVVDPIKLKAAFDRIHAAHLPILKAMPKVSAAVYDSRANGIIPPIRDQGQCGSCWDFSGSGMCTVALILAGQIPNSTDQVSEQYTLDCYNTGKCNGDDNVSVLTHAKATGVPLDSTYGVLYQGRPGQCRSGGKLLQIQDWGFATTGGDQNSIASVQDIKNAVMKYGCVGCAVAAGGDSFWNSGQGIGTGVSHSIDHDVIIVGWDDTKGKGCWIMRNSWGTSWGDKCANSANPNPTEAGYAWVQYGAYDLGTEAVWCVAKSVGPAPAQPVITSPLTATAVVNQPFSYQIVATGSPTTYAFQAVTPVPGFSCSGTGLITGLPTAVGTINLPVVVSNSVGQANATIVVTVSATPVPPPNPGQPPVITSPNTATAAIGQPFTYQIVASNNPVSYDTSPLPAGLTLGGNLISGTPTAAGAFPIVLVAINGAGVGQGVLTLTVSATPQPSTDVIVKLTPDQVRSVVAQSGISSWIKKRIDDEIGPNPKEQTQEPPLVDMQRMDTIERKLGEFEKNLNRIMDFLEKESLKKTSSSVKGLSDETICDCIREYRSVVRGTAGDGARDISTAHGPFGAERSFARSGRGSFEVQGVFVGAEVSEARSFGDYWSDPRASSNRAN